MSIINSLLLTLLISGCAGLFSPKVIEEPPQEDTVLAMKIKAKLIEMKELNAAAIHVEVSNELVILSGFVEKESQRQLASSIAQKISNHKRVENKIKIK